MSKLVIVESPNKIKKIQSILGDDYKVLASVGHIIDLDAESMSIDIKNNFTPTYSINKDKKDVVKKLKKAVEDADEVLLATDGDREGEMIAWSLAETLKLKNPKRIVFYSITKKELDEAIKKPRGLNYEMINAQKSRRILDRIVGYEISPILWKSIKASLSAGRVQSVVTRLILDKENEINDFFKQDENTYFKFYGNFLDSENNSFKTILQNKIINGDKKKKIINDSSDSSISVSDDLNEIEESENGNSIVAKIVGKNNANKLMTTLTKSIYKISNIDNKVSIRNPSPPFTTSTLQQEAGRKLGFAIKRTDTAAQKLHHAGYITYIRTDSVSLSEESLQNIKKYVNDTYGQNYYRRMQYKSKSNNTQEAHEAIRPTDVFKESVENMGNDEVRLYSLIWKRTVASQMSSAKFNQKLISISIDKLKDYLFSTLAEKIDFNGFLAVYNINNIEEDEKSDEPNKTLYDSIPEVGEELQIESLSGNQDYDRPTTRYTEATLVKILDPSKLNIGRPATYSSIINKIQDRGYVERKNIDGIKKEVVQWIYTSKKNKIEEKIGEITIGKENNKLVPTPTGKMVTDFLIKYFPEIMEYKFTADMEDKLDNIAEGKLIWTKMLDDFYCKFHPCVEKIIDKPINIIDESTRTLGTHPQFGLEIYAMNGKYGAMLKMNDPISKSKSIYAPIKKPLTLESITLNDALKILEYPKNLGKYKRSHIILNKGQYGYYLKVGDTNYQVKEDEYKPEELTLENAIEIIQKGEQVQEEKLKNNLWNGKDDFHIYAVKEGQYGKYIQIDSIVKTKSKTKKKPTFVKFPKNTDITDLSLEKIKEIIGKHNKLMRETKKASESSDSAKSVGKKKNNESEVKKKNNESEVKPVKKILVKKTIKNVSTKKITSDDFEEI
jgi:DNA topoisomerase-1